MMTGKQTRMARAALNWTIDALAQRAAVGRMTIMRLEAGNPVSVGTVAKVQAAFEAAGAIFSAADDRVSVSVPK